MMLAKGMQLEKAAITRPPGGKFFTASSTDYTEAELEDLLGRVYRRVHVISSGVNPRNHDEAWVTFEIIVRQV